MILGKLPEIKMIAAAQIEHRQNSVLSILVSVLYAGKKITINEMQIS